ncbi:MAG: hypothetical protein IT368_17170 [Candidatus Hydrogenedentes bacterium]|nr:hypothetical protein [Candidatus Hydrogenedentota bacterium]
MYRVAVALIATVFICLGGCAKIGLDKADLARLKPDLKIGEAEVFSFAVLGEMYLSDARSAAPVNRAVADMNKRGDVAFVVALGNVAADGQYKEVNLLKSAFSKFEGGQYAVPGPTDRDPSKADPYATFEGLLGESPWLHERNGWALMGLSAVAAEGGAAVPAEELDWVAAQLKRFGKDRPIALFIHAPLQADLAEYRLANADAVLAAFEGRPLRLVVSGAYRGEAISESGETIFVSTAGISLAEPNRDGSGLGYRLFHVDKGTVTQEWVPISG